MPGKTAGAIVETGAKAVAVFVAAIAVSVGTIAVSVGAIAVKVGAIAVCVSAIAVCVPDAMVIVGVKAMAVSVGAIMVIVGAIAVSVGGGTVGGGAQSTGCMMLVSSVTAAFCASALPARLALVFMVMLVFAKIFPTNIEAVPTVAELPTCQKTLQPGPAPPLIKMTDEPEAVVSALPTLKIQTALGSPRAFKVRIPVNAADDPKQ